MSETIVKKYILQKNIILENFDKITDNIIYELIVNYYLTSLVSFPTIDNNSNELYKELLTVSLTVQDNLLNLISIFILFKKYNKDFFKSLFDSSNTLTSEQTESILPIIELLTRGDGMEGGQPTSKIILKAFGLLSLLMTSVLPVASDVSTDTGLTSYIQTPINGGPESSNQLALVIQEDTNLLPATFTQERDLQVAKSRREIVSKYGSLGGFVSDLITFQPTDEDLIGDFQLTVGQIQSDYTEVYSQVSNTCKELVNEMASKQLFVSHYIEETANKDNDADIDDDIDDEENSETIYETVKTTATDTMNTLWSAFGYSSTSEVKTSSEEPDIPPSVPKETPTSLVIEPKTQVVAEPKTQVEKILQNAQTSQTLTIKKTNEQVKNALVGFCQSQFKPKIELIKDGDKVFIKRSVNGYPSISSENSQNFFDKFVDILEVIKMTAQKDIESKKSGFSTSSSGEISEIKDIVQKTNIFIQIIEKTKGDLYYFDTKQEFQLKTVDLSVNLDSIKNLIDVFKQFLPQDYINKLKEQQKEALLSKQETKLADIEHEAELESTKAANVRNLENLEEGKKTVENRQEYVKQTVQGTLGTVTAGLGEVLTEGTELAQIALDFGINNIKQILYLCGGAVGLYVIYALITIKLRTTKSGKVPTGNAAVTAPASTATVEPGPTLTQSQQIVTLLNSNIALVSTADLQGNGKFVGFIQTYNANPNTAAALLNLQTYFSNQPNEKIIIFIEPPNNNFRCGKFRGINQQNGTVMVQETNNVRNFTTVTYNDIIDPNLNNYNEIYSDLLQDCVEQITQGPVAPEGVPDVPEGLPDAPEGLPEGVPEGLPEGVPEAPAVNVIPPEGGKRKTLKKYKKKYHKKTKKNAKKMQKNTKRNKKTQKKTKRHKK
jgi:hypothetical protein